MAHISKCTAIQFVLGFISLSFNKLLSKFLLSGLLANRAVRLSLFSYLVSNPCREPGVFKAEEKLLSFCEIALCVA